MPRVSVIVPNYNHERFLVRRIESVLEQTYQDVELILLDDASTDDSAGILETYRNDPRVTIVVNDTNSGSPFAQWNRGVQLAKGDYVWIAEADDDAEPELLETLVQALDDYPSAVFAYCQSWIVDEHGNRLHTARSWTDSLDKTRWNVDFQTHGPEEVRRYLVFQNTIPNASAVVCRRSAFLDVCGAPANMRLCGDWMMWIFLALQGDVAFRAAPLNLFRQHTGTVRASTSQLRFLQESLQVISNIDASVGIPNDIRQELAALLMQRWRSVLWRHPHPIPFSAVIPIGFFLWRMHRVAAMKFFLFFLLLKALGRVGLRPARKLWTAYKRLARAMAA